MNRFILMPRKTRNGRFIAARLEYIHFFSFFTCYLNIFFPPFRSGSNISSSLLFLFFSLISQFHRTVQFKKEREKWERMWHFPIWISRVTFPMLLLYYHLYLVSVSMRRIFWIILSFYLWGGGGRERKGKVRWIALINNIFLKRVRCNGVSKEARTPRDSS